MHKITIMAMPGCQRCAQVAEAIRKVVRVPLIMEMVDITKDQDLLEKYRNDAPVILIDGVERFRQTIDAQKLLQFFADEPGERIIGYTS
ncbi:MAG: glutaredoxin family protein [Phycisphaerales bacterium]|nr:glutaredoxin family protein [Phycisphaerales bacterium]